MLKVRLLLLMVVLWAMELPRSLNWYSTRSILTCVGVSVQHTDDEEVNLKVKKLTPGDCQRY